MANRWDSVRCRGSRALLPVSVYADLAAAVDALLGADVRTDEESARPESPITARVRAFVEAASAITADDPLAHTSVGAIAKQLGVKDRALIDQLVAEAVRLGWLRASGEAHQQAISVTAAWRRQRAPRGRPILPVLHAHKK